MAIFRKWLTKNVSKTVEAVVEPAKEMIKNKKVETGNQVDLVTKVILLGAEIFLVWQLMGKSDDEGANDRRNTSGGHGESSHIVINNYITHGIKEENKDDGK